jgi:hypothetical protein
MLPGLSKCQATHRVPSTGRDGGICPHQKDAPLHLLSPGFVLASSTVESFAAKRYII